MAGAGSTRLIIKPRPRTSRISKLATSISSLVAFARLPSAPGQGSPSKFREWQAGAEGPKKHMYVRLLHS